MDTVLDERSATAKPQTSALGSRLLRAAISGLLAAGAAGCPSDKSDQQGDADAGALSDQELKALCADMVADAEKQGEQSVDLDKACADKISSAQSDADKMCSTDKQTLKDQVSSLSSACEPLIGTAKEKTLSSVQKEYTFAKLTKMCEDRGGYTQVNAGCGGHNVCKGFSYGDWGPGAAMFTENSCAGSNACLGIFCVEAAADQKRAPKDLYELDYPDPGPHACIHCHAATDENGNLDTSTFNVYVFDAADMPYAGPDRTLDNWLTTRTAAQQERIVAFGSHGVLPDGTAYNNMAGYYKYLSRNEIESLVQYIRDDLTPKLTTIKTKDP